MRIRFFNLIVSLRKIPACRARYPQQAASFIGLYEKPMLGQCASVLEELAKKSRDASWLLKNLFIEGFLIHARNVRDFLFNPPVNWNDDIVAADYLTSWNKKIKKECKFLHSKKAQIDRSALHLSYSRIDYESKGKLEIEDCLRINGELEIVWCEFWARLPDEKRRWFLERNEWSPPAS